MSSSVVNFVPTVYYRYLNAHGKGTGSSVFLIVGLFQVL
jgi:hypothetical protein